jgi:outer membrane lipoprotein SlyB
MRFTGCVYLLASLGLAGCAQVVTSAADPAAAGARAAPSSLGTILSMRPVTLRSDRAPWHVALLAAASGTTQAGDDIGRKPTEFIVRTDGGATISVVQTNELGLQPGDRIIILHDDHTHIARPG